MYFQGNLQDTSENTNMHSVSMEHCERPVLVHTLEKPILVRQTHKQCGKKTCINSTQSYDKKYCSECKIQSHTF